VLALGLAAQFGPQLLATLSEPSTPPETVFPRLGITGLYAEEAEICRSRFLEPRELMERPAVTQNGASQQALGVTPALCEIEFRNVSSSEIVLTLDPALISLGVPWAKQYATPQTLPQNQHISIALDPPPGPQELTLYANGHPISLSLK